MTRFLKYMKKVLVSYFIIVAMLACFLVGQATAANGNEGKVTSPGGYSSLHSKSQIKGSVKIIIKVRAPFTPESLLQEKDMHEQRAATMRIQDQVITELTSKGHKPGRVHKYKYVPYIAMTVDGAALDALLSSPDVISIEEDIPVPPTLDLSVPRIGATQLHAIGVTGSGIAVAILDTGVDKTHPFLLGSVVSEACFSSNDSAYGSTSLCPGGVEDAVAEGSAMPYGGSCPLGECGHGTHVAGIAAGRSGISGSPGPGVAPEAGIIAIQVFSLFNSVTYCGSFQPCVLSFDSDQLKGLELVYELRNTYSISSVNMSLGGGSYSANCDSNSLKPTIDNLRTAGIATVIASGNNGYCGYISAPACISSAISVGATDDADAVAYYSNSASFLSLLAPGSSINSSIPLADGGGYQSWNGTSMATPHVTGAWALMKQVYPAATVTEILDSFTSTGLSVTDSGCTSVTKKRINVYEAASLTVSKTGVGTGTVTSDPPGINCGQDCGEVFPKNTIVTLTATADPGSEFGGWNGGGCSGTGACTVDLSVIPSVTASFLKEVTIGTEIIISGSGYGEKKGKVFIGDVVTKIAKGGWADDAITFTVTKVPTGSPDIFALTIIPKSKEDASIPLYDACIVKSPEIVSLSDNHGAAGAPITINGKLFGAKKPKVYVEYIDKNGQTKTKSCKVAVYLPMDKTTGESDLEFVVPKLPEGAAPGPHQLKVVNKVGSATTPFTVDPSP